MLDFLDPKPTVLIENGGEDLVAASPSRLLPKGIGAAFLLLLTVYELAHSLATVSPMDTFERVIALTVGFALSLPLAWICWIWLQLIGGKHEVVTIKPDTLSIKRAAFGRMWNAKIFSLADAKPPLRRVGLWAIFICIRFALRISGAKLQIFPRNESS